MRPAPRSKFCAVACVAILAAGVMLSACGVLPAGHAATAGSFARLGPAKDPVHLYYDDIGRGPPILLIHGFGASTFTWHQIMPDLARNHRVIAVDMKGFGRSDKPMDENYSEFDQAALLEQLILEKNLRNLTIVGHSFGGGVALALALDDRLKGRISQLVLIDSVAYPQKVPVFFKMLDVPGMAQLGINMVPAEMQAKVALKIAYYDPNKITPATVAAYAAPLKTAAGKHAVIYTAREIVPPDLEALTRRYDTIELPTLIMWCDHDRIVPFDIGLKLRRNIPHSQLRVISRCGHIPQEEQPAQTLEVLQKFLNAPTRELAKE